MNRGLWNFSLFLLVSGLLLLAAGLLLREAVKRRRELKGHTRARVVDLVLREVPQNSGITFRNRYYPVLEFYANGRLFKENYPYGAYPAAFSVGEEVPIDYDIKDPHEYEIRRRTWQGSLPELMYLAGIIMVVLGALLFILFASRG